MSEGSIEKLLRELRSIAAGAAVEMTTPVVIGAAVVGRAAALLGPTRVPLDPKSWTEGMVRSWIGELEELVPDSRTIEVDGAGATFTVKTTGHAQGIGNADVRRLPSSYDVLVGRRGSIGRILESPASRSYLKEYSEDELRALWRASRP